jgi:hypothetical protein
VIVMFVVEKVFVTCDAIGQFELAREAAFGQQFHRAINGCVTDSRILHFNALVDIFDASMTLVIQKDLKDSFAMGSDFEIPFAQEADQHLHFGFDGLHGPGCPN